MVHSFFRSFTRSSFHPWCRSSGEFGNRPGKFKEVYAKAKAEGLRLVAHAGEEGDAGYITEALDELKIERVDHGVRCLEDDAVVARLVKEQIPLTCCPCSNHRLQVHSRFFCGESSIRPLLAKGIKVTINSDDPAYFFMGPVDPDGRPLPEKASGPVYDGYINSNYLRTVRDCGLTASSVRRHAHPTRPLFPSLSAVDCFISSLHPNPQLNLPSVQADECVILARNSFEASFISDAAKEVRRWRWRWRPWSRWS